MRAGTKRALGTVFAVAVVAGAMLLALRFVVRSLEGEALRERARAGVEAGLTRALAELGLEARVRVGSLEGPLLPTLVLRDVRVEAEGGTPLRIERLSGRVDLRALLARRAVLEDLRAEGLALELAREEAPSPEAAPRWTWERIRRERPPKGAEKWWDAFVPTRLELRGLEIPAARLVLRFTQEGRPSVIEAEADGSLAGLAFALGAQGREAGVPSPWPEAAGLALRVSPGSVAGRRLEGATATLRLEGSQLRIAEASLESAFGRARVTGETDLARWLAADGVAELALEGETEGLDLGVLLERPAVAGALSLRGTLAVERAAGAALEAGRARADLTLGPSRLGALRLDAGRLRGRYDAGTFAIEEARLDGSPGSLRARGEGARGRIGSLALDADLRDLAALDAVAALAGRKPFGLAGAATLRATVQGVWTRPAGTLELETRALRAAGLALGHIGLRAESPDGTRIVLAPFRVHGEAIDLEALEPVRLRREGDGVWIEALRLRGPRDAVASAAGFVSAEGVRDLHVELPAVELAPFAPLLGPERTLGGVASLRLVANGAFPRPTLSGDFAWLAPRVDRFEAERIDATIATERGAARAEIVLRGAGRELLHATATGPWRADVAPREALARGDATLHVVGDGLDLALLDRVLAPDLARLEGRADLVLDVRGGATGPEFEGSLRVAGAHFDVAALGQRMGPLDARLALGRDGVRVEELILLGSDGGRASLKGAVALDAFRLGHAELALALDDFPVRYQTSLRFRANGRLDASGPLDALYARGEARLDAFRFYLRPGSDPLLREITVIEPGETPRLARREIVTPAPSAGGPWEGASVDVKIVVPRESFVVGQGANVEIEGDVRAAKAPQGPLGLYGTIRTLSGSYRAQGRIFTIAPSKVVFDGPADTAPLLDVRAEGSAGGAKILARVQGRASDPAIRLESEPPYPERDILALLLFGRTRDQLGRNEAGALQSFLAQTTGGAAVESLNAFLGPTLRVDTIEATPSERGEGGSIGIGRWLTDDIFVQYGQGYGDAAGSEASVNWKFLPRWSLESRYSTERGSSADVIWSYDY